MTTPTWTAFAEPSQFHNEAFSDIPVAGAGDTDFDDWASQLNSSVLELQTPAPRIIEMNESSGSTLSTSTTNPTSIWDDRSPMVGMPSNGRAALAAIMQEQKNPEEFNLFGTDQVAAAAPPEVTDQLLFQQLRGRAGTAAMIWDILKKDTAFRNAVSDFQKNFERTVGRPLRQLTVDFWKVLIMKNQFSTELATAVTVIAITDGTTNKTHSDLRQSRANTLRVMLYLEMYLDAQDHLLGSYFDDVKTGDLDFTSITGQTHPSPSERPGFHRLADRDPVVRDRNWTAFFTGVCNVICGIREKAKVDPSTAREDYFISSSSHGLMMRIQPDGDLEPVSVWFGAEEIACNRLVSLATMRRKPKWLPDTEDRVKNSITAMKGRDILPFYNRNFPLSVLVQDNHEFLEGGTPDVSWEIQKLLIQEAEAIMRRDPSRAVRLDSRQQTPATPSAAEPPTPAAPKTPPAAPAGAPKPKKPKGPCRAFASTGECRFGANCRFGHDADTAAKPAATANLPAAVAMQDPEEDQMGPDLTEFTCGACLGPGCAATFKTCPSFWTALGLKQHKAYVTPNACKYCRTIKRANFNANRRVNTKVDADGKPVEEVAALAMAADNTGEPAQEPLTEPFLIDLDADDEDAMADYASRFYSELMMTVETDGAPAEVVKPECTHPEFFCPAGYLIVDYVEHAYCSICDERVDLESAGYCFEAEAHSPCKHQRSPEPTSSDELEGFDSVAIPSEFGDTWEELSSPCPYINRPPENDQVGVVSAADLAQLVDICASGNFNEIPGPEVHDQGADIRSIMEARDKLHFHGAPSHSLGAGIGAPSHSLIKDPVSSLIASGNYVEVPIPDSLAFTDAERACMDIRELNAAMASPEPESEDDLPISRMKRSPLPVNRHRSKGKRSAADHAPVCGNNTLASPTTASTKPTTSWLTEYAAAARVRNTHLAAMAAIRNTHRSHVPKLNLASSWMNAGSPTHQKLPFGFKGMAATFSTPREIDLMTIDRSDGELCMTCNGQGQPIIWCRGCNYGECELCVGARGYLQCLCSVDNVEMTAEAAMQSGIYSHQLNTASIMIINQSKAVLVTSEMTASGTVLDLPETLFSVNSHGAITYLEPLSEGLKVPLHCSHFRFLTLNPCIIIADTGNFSTESLGELEWISINLMRDPVTSVQLHALAHVLNVGCGAVQHSHPEVWMRNQQLTPTSIAAGRTMGQSYSDDERFVNLGHSALFSPAPPTPLWNRRMEKLQQQYRDQHGRTKDHRKLQSPQARAMYRKRAPPSTPFSFDADHMETVEIEDVSSEYDSEEMDLLNTSSALSVDRIKSSDDDTDDEVQSLNAQLVRRRCTNATFPSLQPVGLAFDEGAQSEDDASPAGFRQQHQEQHGSNPDFRSGRRPRN